MLLYLSGNTKALMQRLPALLILLAAAVIVSPAWAADSRHAFRALSVIWDTIEAICSEVSLEGSSQDITATGRVSDTDKGDRNFEFQASEFKGLSSDEIFSAAKSNVGCRLKVLEMLLSKLLPPPEQTNTSTSDNTAIRYEILEDPGSFVTGVMNSICYFRLGMAKLTSEGKCTRDACSVEYEQQTAYSDTTVYITPQFTVILSDPFRRPGTSPRTSPAKISSAKSEWPSSLPAGRVMVDSKLVMTRDGGNAPLLTDCVEKVGTLVLDRFRLYDLGSVIAKLPNEKQADYSANQSTLSDLDHAMLQIWLPKSINSGSAFTLEARLVPASSLTAEIPGVDPHTVDKEARDHFEKLMREGFENLMTKAAVSRDRISFTVEFKSSSYRMLELVTKKDEIETAAIKFTGEHLTAAALAPEHQAMKPFKATIWSWLVKPTGSGERSAYLSIEAKRADGKIISSVVPVRFVVQEDMLQTTARFVSANWQWIAGTVVIPGLVFLWSKLVGKKGVPSEHPQPSPPETSRQPDRRDSRRRR